MTNSSLNRRAAADVRDHHGRLAGSLGAPGSVQSGAGSIHGSYVTPSSRRRSSVIVVVVHHRRDRFGGFTLASAQEATHHPAMAERRLPVVPIALASASFVIAIVAVAVIMTRDGAKQSPRQPAASDPKPDKTAQSAAAPFVDITVKANDVFLLMRHGVRVAGADVVGVRVDDAQARKTLGLEAGDVVTAVSGRDLEKENDLGAMLTSVGIGNAKRIYLEVMRGTQPTLVRWRIDGSLMEAYFRADTMALRNPR